VEPFLGEVFGRQKTTEENDLRKMALEGVGGDVTSLKNGTGNIIRAVEIHGEVDSGTPSSKIYKQWRNKNSGLESLGKESITDRWGGRERIAKPEG